MYIEVFFVEIRATLLFFWECKKNYYCQGTIQIKCMICGPTDRSRVTMNYKCCSHLLIVRIAEHYPGNKNKSSFVDPLDMPLPTNTLPAHIQLLTHQLLF